MIDLLKKTWSEVVDPLIRRPNRIQVATLCYRDSDSGIEFLLITSLDTGRWIIPKGWPMDGKDARAAAQQEAWEEAGVAQGVISQDPIGSYDYVKQLNTGGEVTCTTQVFALEVTEMAGVFPESGQRTLQWAPQNRAAEMVVEPALQDILRGFSKPD